MKTIGDTKKTAKPPQEIPEYKKAGEEIKNHQKRIESLINSSSDIIFLKDKNFRYLIANKTHEKLFNIKVEDIIGKTDFDFMPKEVAEEYRKSDEKALKSGSISREEWVGEKCFHIAKQRVVDAKGKIIGIAAVIRDITEHKKIEEVLRENEEKFRTIFENVYDAIVYVDRYGKVVDVNKRVEEVFGYRRDEIIGKNIFTTSFFKPKSLLKMIKLFQRAIRTGEMIPLIEVEVRHRNDKMIPVEVSNKPVRKNGRIEGMLAIVRDITERKQAERALQEEKNKLQKYLDVAGIIVLVLSPEGKVLLINNKGSEVLGYKGREILGKDWFTNFIPEKNRAEVRAFFEKLINEIVDHVEYFANLILTKNGEKKTISWHNSLLKDEKGRVQAILSTGADITELKQAKMTIEQLKELDKMKDEFLNIAAHELRTPLTSIIGLSEIIKEQKPSLNSQYQKYINIIYDEGIKLNHIIQRILVVTRFESGRERVYSEPFNLTIFISLLLLALDILVKKKKSRIITNIEKKNIFIRSDKEKISQVIYNFIDNAAKYGPEGQTITISITKPEKDWVKIAVIDQGPGISPELQKKLFTKFSQLEPSLTRSQGGTGLGLYICKLIVDMLGGKIGVKSKLGKGSTFYFILPINKPSESPRKNKITSF